MPFGPKTWMDYPNTTTPITAAALEDLETRLGAYTDTGDSTTVTTAEGYTDTRIGDIVALGNVGANWQGTWSSGTTYAKGAGVARNAQLYVSVQASNLNHDPATDTTATWWAPVTKQVGLGVDVWASQSTPASVTDWGTIINSLLSGGARCLLFGEHDFPFTTKINLASSSYVGVVFQGASGRSWGNPHQVKTRLIWKGGAGTGVAVDLTGAQGTEFRELGIMYDNAAYDGNLIDANSNGTSFERCSLTSSPFNTVRSANSIVKLNNAVGVSFTNCTIAGAATVVRGHETAATVSNQVEFTDCLFDTFGTGGIANCGQDWTFRACTWQFDHSPANACGIITDVNSSDSASVYLDDGCTFWDYSNSGQQVIKTSSAHTTSFYFSFQNGSVHAGGQMTFGAPGGVILKNVKDLAAVAYPAAPIIDFGTSAGGSAKEWIIVDMPVSDSNGTGDLGRTFANLDGGHNYINVQGKGQGGIAYNCRTIAGHERISRGPAGALPAIAQDASQSGLTLQVIGNDYKGVIKISGTVIAGTICKLTFSKPLIGGFSNGLQLNLGLPLKSWNGETFDPATAYTSQVYGAQISQTDLTGFTIGCVTGWTSKQIAIPYEVAAMMIG